MRTGGCASLRSLCALWLLLCLAPRVWGQRSAGEESEGLATGARLEEKDALCHERGCYAVFLQRRTFREAGRSCRERGGTLATAHDHETADAVHRLLAGLEPQGTRVRLRLWIGLHRAPRQCSSTRPLRGFVWVTGDQEGQFTNWLREDAPGTCAAPRCVAMTVHTSESARDSVDNFKWLDGSCGLALDGFVCQYAYRGMCHPLEDEGQGPAVYSTPFHLISRMLTHVPYGSVAAVPCPPRPSDPDAPAEQTVLCMERDDGSVGWSRDAPLCGADLAPTTQDWCSGDHGCEQHCQNTDSDYYCYCSEGYTLAEDGYSCETDPLDPTDPPELSLDSAGPSELPRLKVACMAMGCEHDCVETSRGVRCTCPPGYQIGPDGRRCSDVDECQQGPCTQACVNAPGTFHCACHAGYEPDDEGECVDVDECEHEGRCEGTCENTEGSFRCTCHHGYQMSASRTCEDVDECVGASPCQQQCLNYMGGYQCFCDDGYELQADRLTCRPTPDDEEYSTLTPDPTDSAHILDLDHDGLRTPKPKFDSNFDVEWLTDAPEESNNHLNQWDVASPRRYQTEPSPTREESKSNEVYLKTGGQEDDRQAPTEGAGASEGKRKHDKSWLLVALLVPLCVFLVVMLALGIVYCTSCAVDKSLGLSDCYRWILPTAPPDRTEPKTRA
ncbi:endosialin-like [Dunckerocampus dactyliophorus]|uniref:endosialin-like n=1 Tax=Dunckerocampus dactyliophorus TaxID=161453 RepID=UPI0024071B50|nr:endosialin-like [Dunckerocampus dactyliophorus]